MFGAGVDFAHFDAAEHTARVHGHGSGGGRGGAISQLAELIASPREDLAGSCEHKVMHGAGHADDGIAGGQPLPDFHRFDDARIR